MKLRKVEPKILGIILMEQKRGKPLEEIAKTLNKLCVALPECDEAWTALLVGEVLDSNAGVVPPSSTDGDI